MTELTQEIYPDAKVKYTPLTKTASSSSNEEIPTLEQYLSRSSSSIEYIIMLPDEHDTTLYKDELNALCEKLEENKVVCMINILYSNDHDQYDSFVTDKWTDDHIICKLRGYVRIGEDFEIKYESWR